jgi:hypothetical protein
MDGPKFRPRIVHLRDFFTAAAHFHGLAYGLLQIMPGLRRKRFQIAAGAATNKEFIELLCTT